MTDISRIPILDLERARGDTSPIALTVAFADGTPVNITGYQFRLAVDAQPSPSGLSDLFPLIVEDAPVSWWKAPATDTAAFVNIEDEGAANNDLFLFGSAPLLKGEPSLIADAGSASVRTPVVPGVGMRALHADLFDSPPFSLEYVASLDRLPSLVGDTGIFFIKRTNGDTETTYSLGIGFNGSFPNQPYWTVFDTSGTKTSITHAKILARHETFHVVATLSAGLQMQLFVNGVKAASTPTTPAIYASGSDSFLYLMSGVGSERFIGRGLPAAVYDKVLADDRVLLHAQAALGLSSTRLFQVNGTVVDGAAGEVEFPLTADEADQVPGDYWWDADWIDTTGTVRTWIRGRYRLVQDRAK